MRREIFLVSVWKLSDEQKRVLESLASAQRDELPVLLSNWQNPPACSHRFAVIEVCPALRTILMPDLVEWERAHTSLDQDDSGHRSILLGAPGTDA